MFRISKTFSREDGPLMALADELGLDFTRGSKNRGPRLSGKLNGRKVRIRLGRIAGTELEVRYTSGLQHMTVRRREGKIITNAVDITSGQPLFDQQFRILVRDLDLADDAQRFLNPARCAIIAQLNNDIGLEKVNEREIVAVIDDRSPAPDEIRRVLQACVTAADALEAPTI